MDSHTTSPATKIDEGLYSRQMYVYDEKTMGKLSSAVILITQLTVLATEIVKNLALTGVKEIDIVKHELTVDEYEYGVNYYVSKNDVGNCLEDVVVPRLRELNGYVTINLIDKMPHGDELKKYNCVVMVDTLSHDRQIELNNMTRELNIPYVLTHTKGLTGSVFCDFGKQFHVADTNGEPAKNVPISQIYVMKSDTSEHWVVETANYHDMSPDDILILHNSRTNKSEGMYKVKSCPKPDTLYLEKGCADCPDFNPLNYVSYGEVHQVKTGVTINFKSLEHSYREPQFVYNDLAHFERPAQLHKILLTWNAYFKKYNKVPQPFNTVDFANFMELGKLFIDSENKDDILDEPLFKKFINHGNGNIIPVVSVIGALASQEIVKAVTNKYMPIQQFLHFESFDSLPDFKDNVPEDFKADYTDRYYSVTSVFGKTFMEQVKKLKLFMVGTGAIGCELLKNFAQMGVGTSPDGCIKMTDMDTIERSNLNRQFLFRSGDIGKLKSEAAKLAILQMNPDVNIESMQDKVCPETEHIFNHEFWENIDIVANALDNVQARLYVDRQCVNYQKSLLESGTLGTKGNVQIVTPLALTQSYGSSYDPPETGIPMCTLKSFPHLIDHTIQWARDAFEELFKVVPDVINRLIDDRQFIDTLGDNDLHQYYNIAKRYGTQDAPQNLVDCVIVGYKHFVYYYRDMIKSLLACYPPDHTTPKGDPFWSGSKRCPEPIEFNCNNKLHLDYVLHFAHLYAYMFGVGTGGLNDNYVKTVIQSNPNINFYPVNEKFGADEAEQKKMDAENTHVNSHQMVSELKSIALNVIHVLPHEFEKDDDSNHHIDFITCASNLRATGYQITPADRHKTKGIAGRIIPAIATTTALVSGLVSLELYKVVAGHSNVEKYRNAFINLALSTMLFSDPISATKNKISGKDYTLWDYIHVNENRSLKLYELMEIVSEKLGTSVDSVDHNPASLYSFILSNTEKARRLEMDVEDILTEMGIKCNPNGYVTLQVDLEEDCDVVVPDVHYWTYPK
jgi:ubiquitin-activating enzyme E1